MPESVANSDIMPEFAAQAKPDLEKGQRNTTLSWTRTQGRLWTQELQLKARPVQVNWSRPQELHGPPR
jgi:hypothetical protein